MSVRMIKGGTAAALIALLALLLAACGGSDGDEGTTTTSGGGGDLSGTKMTFTSYGGDQEVAYREAYVEPFMENTGAEVALDSPTDYAKVKAQVESNNVTWDVMIGDPFLTIKDCGVLYEELDIDRSEISPQYLTDDCSVPADIYATVLVYDKKKFGDDPPTSWADFFDLEKYPGKRGMWSFVIGNQLEHALQADGVESDQLYPLDMDRAFAKLDTIKSEISFYDTLAQSSEQLISGEVVMSIAYAQRAYDAEKAGADIGVVWDGGIQSWDSVVVLKGTKNLEAATQLASFFGAKESQEHMASITPFGPTNSTAEPDVPEDIAKWLATTPENAEVSVPMDMKWWSENYDAANQAFTDWTSG